MSCSLNCVNLHLDLVCDPYKSPSIKDIQHARHGATDIEMIITGSDQRRPRRYKCSKSTNFKMALFQFVVSEWQQDAHQGTLQQHTLYVRLEGVTYVFEVVDRIVRKLVRDLHC